MRASVEKCLVGKLVRQNGSVLGIFNESGFEILNPRLAFGLSRNGLSDVF